MIKLEMWFWKEIWFVVQSLCPTILLSGLVVERKIKLSRASQNWGKKPKVGWDPFDLLEEGGPRPEKTKRPCLKVENVNAIPNRHIMCADQKTTNSMQ